MATKTNNKRPASPRHILQSGQFTHEFLDTLFKRAAKLKTYLEKGQPIDRTLAGKVMISLFYESSTRTRFSFEIAAKLLGMEVVESESAGHFSSAIKGESLEDSMKVFSCYYPAAIVLRHPEDGAADRAARVSSVPIINAGDGKNEHPTQALLDLFTIYNKLGRLRGLKVMLGGDLANGRTARSLVKLLMTYPDNHFFFASQPGLGVGVDLKEELHANGSHYHETDDPMLVIDQADVVYWTRTQIERGAVADQDFILTPQELAFLKPEAILMHPLPRVNEIDTNLDSDPRAVYFEQAGNGLPVRMALLEWVVTKG